MSPSQPKRRPVHLIVIGGLATAVYALALAAVTSAQVAADKALIGARDPIRHAVERLSRSYNHLQTAIDRSRAHYTSTADDYDDMKLKLGDFELGIDGLARLMSEIEGVAAQLPARVDLPSVPQGAPAPQAAAPQAAPPQAAAPKAQPPKTHANTGASGGH